MTAAFDPYHVWLGIHPSEQPPNYYRLLAIQLFESNATVIDNSAERQMAHLRGFQSGEHRQQANRLLNEIATVRICLLDPRKKEQYDRQLRQQIGQAAQHRLASPSAVPGRVPLRAPPPSVNPMLPPNRGGTAAPITRPNQPAPPAGRRDAPTRAPAAVAVSGDSSRLSAPPIRSTPIAARPRACDVLPIVGEYELTHLESESLERLRMARVNNLGLWLMSVVSDIPAWFVSMGVHMVLLIALGMLSPTQQEHEPWITLNAIYHAEDLEVAFELPVPEEDQPTTAAEHRALLAADQDARELRLDAGVNEPNLARLTEVKDLIGSSEGRASAFAGRDPRVRVEIVTAEGGTTLTEAAVARGLAWLARHQHVDGSWSLTHFHEAGDCNGRCSGQGNRRLVPEAGTALALMAFLGAGQTHQVGRYRDQVDKGLQWLQDQQLSGGNFSNKYKSLGAMYTNAQAGIVLCEAYAMTRDEQLAQPAQRAIDFIVRAQHSGGGWRYQPGTQGDTSVFGWQLMALQSGLAADLTVPSSTFDKANQYLNSVQKNRGAAYSYRAKGRATDTMTAEGLLCRVYLGWTKRNRGLNAGVNYLANKRLPRENVPNVYYWYYTTQLMHHYGGEPWENWNSRMRDVLVSTQVTDGHAAGSWNATRNKHSTMAGRLYETALSICVLEVYYRHLPIFRRLDIE